MTMLDEPATAGRGKAVSAARGTNETAGARRIAAAFARARGEGRAALIPYVVAGYPDAEASLTIALAAADAGADSIAVLDQVRTSEGPKATHEVRLAMQKAMQTDVSVFRTQESLDEGVRRTTAIDGQFEQIGIKDRSMIWNSDLVETLELRNLLTCA